MAFDDEAASLPFSKRLARENGWSHRFASLVVEEYRRFLYLAVTAGFAVTPSDEVDQAWHLHLAYTRHYWDFMCGEILGQPLHHGPTKGGASEGERYFEAYAATLGAYRNAFGEAPPAQVWPDPNRRFSDVEGFRRVNNSQFLILPRSRVRNGLVAVSGVLLAGCTWPFSAEDMLMIGFFVALVYWWYKKPPGKGGGKGDGSGGAGCGGCGGCGGCS